MTCVDREQNLPLRETPERSHGIHWRDVQRGQLESQTNSRRWPQGRADQEANPIAAQRQPVLWKVYLQDFTTANTNSASQTARDRTWGHKAPRSEKSQVSACHDRSGRTQVSARRQRLQPKGSVEMGRGPPLSKGRREKRPSSRANKGSRALVLNDREIPGRAQRWDMWRDRRHLLSPPPSSSPSPLLSTPSVQYLITKDSKLCPTPKSVRWLWMSRRRCRP